MIVEIHPQYDANRRPCRRVSRIQKHITLAFTLRTHLLKYIQILNVAMRNTSVLLLTTVQSHPYRLAGNEVSSARQVMFLRELDYIIVSEILIP